LEAGLVRGGGHLACQIAEVVFDLSEGFLLRKIDESFGHLAEEVFGVGPQLPEQVMNACFAVGKGRGSSRGSRVTHTVHPGKKSWIGVEFSLGFPGYHWVIDFSPTFLKHTPTFNRDHFFIDNPGHSVYSYSW